MKTILVPTDFSSASRNAEEYAIWFAKAMNTKVKLLHVYREHIPAFVDTEPGDFSHTEVYINNEKDLFKEIDYLNGKFSMEVDGDLKIGGRSDSIQKVADEINAGLIVMGMPARDKIKGKSSTILKTIRKSRIPVLIVPGTAAYKPIKNVVIAVDFNEMTTSASFTPLLEMVQKFDASLKVIHVEKPGEEMRSSEVPEKLQLAESLAAFTYEFDRLEFDDTDLAIESFLEAHATDLLVVLAHHHSLFERLFGNTHTKKLSADVSIPVLVLREW
jgi:nucleotide-binding universal stress UspA family protein